MRNSDDTDLLPGGESGRPQWLRTGDEVFRAMLSAIDGARNSIRLETYIYTDTEIGRQFRGALVIACKRGVRVQVMVDAWGSMGLPDGFWDSLREVGGEFRWFNPIRFRSVNLRNHRKVLVCDERVAFVGGFNISKEYQGDGVTCGWYDLGIKVEGEMARALAMSFDTHLTLADMRHRRFVSLRRKRTQSSVNTPYGQLIEGGPGRGPNLFKKLLLTELGRAESIEIICAYFLPIRPIRKALMLAAHRGKKVRLILAGKSDVALSRLASHRYYTTLLRAGVEIYEYQPQILHAKLFLFDDAVYVGSSNLDRRSFYLNYELLLRLGVEETAREAREIFEECLQRCERIELPAWRKSRSHWQKFKELCAYAILGRVDPVFSRRQARFLR